MGYSPWSQKESVMTEVSRKCDIDSVIMPVFFSNLLFYFFRVICFFFFFFLVAWFFVFVFLQESFALLCEAMIHCHVG